MKSPPPPLKSPWGRSATINSNSLNSKNNKSDLPGGLIPLNITRVSTSNLSEAHFSGTLRMSTDDACQLWKSIGPMQLFTLYNFASSIVAARGGPDSDVERKPPKIQDFACSGPLPRFPAHPERYSPTLEIHQTDATFHALQLCKQYRRSLSWASWLSRVNIAQNP